MRELRFRYWVKSCPKNYCCHCQRHDGLQGEMVYNTYPTEEGVEDGLIYMQWTGLKDKNGKYIYEGDIIASTSTCTIATVEYNNEKVGYIAVSTSPKLSFTDKAYFDTSNVLGNIYENKELLDV